jgi:hypothetical protein
MLAAAFRANGEVSRDERLLLFGEGSAFGHRKVYQGADERQWIWEWGSAPGSLKGASQEVGVAVWPACSTEVGEVREGTAGRGALIGRFGVLLVRRGFRHFLVLDLERRFRCRECDQRGKVVVSIRWAAG